MTKKVIVHILELHIRFHRTILNIDLNIDPDIEYIVFAHRNYKKIFDKFKLKCKIYYFESTNKIYSRINYFNPDYILLTVSCKNDYVDKLHKYVHCRQIYYIHHGLFLQLNNYETTTTIKTKWSKKIKYIVSDNNAFDVIQKNVTSNVYKINGLPQFDYILKNKKRIINKKLLYKKFNIPKNKKLCLIVKGSPLFTTVTINAINMINISFVDIFFLIKTKKISKEINTKLEIKKNMEKLKNINLIEIPCDDLLYDYLGCDINIVCEGGTSFIESLLVNSNTILFQVKTSTHLNFDIINNYNLRVAKTYNSLINNVREVINNVKTPIDSSGYIKSIMGNNIKYSVPQIINILKQNYKQQKPLPKFNTVYKHKAIKKIIEMYNATIIDDNDKKRFINIIKNNAELR